MNDEYIKNTPLFGELTADEQRAIGQRMRLEQYGPGETLFMKNGESNALYLIKEGWVKLADGAGSAVVASLGPGSLLGETDFLTGRPYSMTARTSSEVIVWSLEQAALKGLIEERPELGVYLGLAFGKGIVQFQRQLAERLTDVPLLQDLSLRERSLLAQYLSPQRYYAGETIYRSGDSPTGLFIVEKGAVHLLGDTDDDYTELAYSEAFGEMAVVSNTPHSNTAKAANELILWQLSPVDFATLTQTNPTIKTNLSRNLRARLSASDQAYAIALLERVSLFSGLSREVLTDIVRLLLLRHVPAGEIIFSQGDPGDAMYIVDSGTVFADSPRTPGQMKYRFSDGDIFGETALLTGKTRNFTAHATSDANLWCLYRTDFDNLLLKHPQISVALSQALRDRLDAVDEYAVEPHLQKIAVAGGLTRTQLDELSARLQPRRYQGGSTIYFEGSGSDGMYFIERGQVELWANTAQGPILLESLAEGDYFGEIALLSGRPRLGTAYALVETVIWALSKADFDDFLQRYPNLGVVMSRILSQRMEDTMARLRGTATQRGLPAPGGPSQTGPRFASPAGQPGSNRPSYPAGPGRSLRPVSQSSGGMPPVSLRPVTPPGSRPPAALPPPTSSFSRGLPAQPRPPAYGQPTQPLRPVSVPGARPPSVNARQTQRMAPAHSPHAQHTQAMPAPPKKQTRSTKPRRKVRKKKNAPQATPTAPMAAQAPPSARPAKQGQLPPSTAPDAKPAQSKSGFRVRARSISNRRLEDHRRSLSVWFARRSLGAKLRLLAICIALVWLCGIMVPSLIINALASTFADEGALPGDSRSPLQQMREDGALGAAAVLPFVETTTPTPTNSPTPTSTPTQTSTPTPTPIPSNTPTPTLTPTPTETPTPVFTPTPTSTPTRAFTRAPLPPTETPTPEPTPTPAVDYRIKSVRQLTPCENQGKHHIFVKVEDINGQGINDVPVKVQWSPVPDGHVLVETETKTNLTGEPEPGRFDFAMFKGSYTVEVVAGTSEVAGPVTPDYGTNEPCGENAVANSLFHISYEIIFQRTF